MTQTLAQKISKKSLWFQSGQIFVAVAKEASTCRSKRQKGGLIDRTCDYVFACHSLKGIFSQMKVVEDRVEAAQSSIHCGRERRGGTEKKWAEDA